MKKFSKKLFLNTPVLAGHLALVSGYAQQILDPREYEVIDRRFGLSHDMNACPAFDEVGAVMGLHKSRIHQLEGKAVRKLRAHIQRNQLMQNAFEGILSERMRLPIKPV